MHHRYFPVDLFLEDHAGFHECTRIAFLDGQAYLPDIDECIEDAAITQVEVIRPQCSVSSATSSSCTKDGTMVSFTRSHRPSRQVAVALTRPAAVSSITIVSGSCISTMPLSSNAVVTQIEFDPELACA